MNVEPATSKSDREMQSSAVSPSSLTSSKSSCDSDISSLETAAASLVKLSTSKQRLPKIQSTQEQYQCLDDYLALFKHNDCFPQQLMCLLFYPGLQNYIKWMKDGRSFWIPRKQVFIDKVVKKHFAINEKYNQRMLACQFRNWGFRLITDGPFTGALWHPLFRRDNPTLCLKMKFMNTKDDTFNLFKVSKSVSEPQMQKASKNMDLTKQDDRNTESTKMTQRTPMRPNHISPNRGMEFSYPRPYGGPMHTMRSPDRMGEMHSSNHDHGNYRPMMMSKVQRLPYEMQRHNVYNDNGQSPQVRPSSSSSDQSTHSKVQLPKPNNPAVSALKYNIAPTPTKKAGDSTDIVPTKNHVQVSDEESSTSTSASEMDQKEQEEKEKVVVEPPKQKKPKKVNTKSAKKKEPKKATKSKAATLAEALLRGVTVRPSGRWQAQLYYAGKSRYLGVFDTREEAAYAYEVARDFLQAKPKVNSTELYDAYVAAAKEKMFAEYKLKFQEKAN